MLDFLIRGGHVIDTARGVDEVQDVAVRDGRIVAYDGSEEAANVIDATGAYVTPGLIDAHSHSYYPGSGLGVQPDFLASAGITAVMDAGTAGWCNYSAFHNTTVVNSRVKVKALVAYNNSGQIELGYMEDYRRKSIKVEKIRHILEKYPGEVMGLKMRFQEEVVGKDGLHYLQEMLEIADELGCPVTVHTTNPPVPASEIVKLLRPGDIYCHCFQGRKNLIVDENGEIYPEVLEARKRGVLFDAANGTGNFAFCAAVPALKAGFLPDIISADNASNSFGKDLYAKNLPFVMSKYLTLGMSLYDVIRCTTENPAKVLKEEGRLGTLKPGACADVAIMKLVHKKQVFWDSVKNPTTAMEGDVILVPQMTLIDGDVAFRANDF